MKAGQYINTGQSMSSSNKQYTVTLQSDGQIVVRRNPTNDIVWSSDTVYNNVAKLQLNYDNNLILYGTNGTQLWTSGTYDVEKFASLVMNNDGDLSTDVLWNNWRTDTHVSTRLLLVDARDQLTILVSGLKWSHRHA